ncbi:MAG: 4-hydroxythreonine-4-phosphate dehydrogenase PdxA [Candidatus Aureabacteria bacterium]|nr:4-hydroxythreonine-4-phosphate dehydrogenase PdxA [Candidatus Auribacterota bacterium]
MIDDLPFKFPLILITMGDPAGVGPEIILKTLRNSRKLERYIIFGDHKTLKKACKSINFPSEKLIQDHFAKNHIRVSGSQLTQNFLIKDAGRPNAIFGKASVKWIEEAVLFSKRLKKKNIPHALVTAPINKEAAHMGGFRYNGHTDYLSHLYKSPDTSMMFYDKKLNVILTTIHCSLEQAIKKINRKLIFQKIIHADSALKKWGISKPVILVAGLNPHAGEAGAFGNEEIKHIIPAIEKAVSIGINVKGPFPPDTVFLKALFDPSKCVVSMYHDQGLIAFKLFAFSTGVNVTFGLPTLRTSPDHGTAYDIAWKNTADPKSFHQALKLSLKSISPKSSL